MTLLERWTANDDNMETRAKNFHDLNKMDKVSLSSTAQQKLIEAIRSKPDVLMTHIPKSFTTKRCDNYFLLLPDLNLPKVKNELLSKKFENWIFTIKRDTTSKTIKIKQRMTKEMLTLSNSCKIAMTEALMKEDFTQVKQIEKERANAFLIDIRSEPSFRHKNIYNNFSVWETPSEVNVLNVLAETIEFPENIPMVPTSPIEPIPNQFFLGDCLLQVNLLPSSYFLKNRHHKFSRKWKFSKKINWNISQIVISQLLDEKVNRFELKFRLLIKPLDDIKFSIVKDNPLNKIELWNLSEYQTYMINWKPFGNMNLENTLEEECSKHIAITMPPNNENEEYIKLSELKTNEQKDVILGYNDIIVDLNSSTESSKPKIEEKINIEEHLFEPAAEHAINMSNELQNKETLPVHALELCNQSLNLKGNASLKSEVNLESAEVKISDKSIISPKRVLDDFDSLIQKKKTRNNPTQLDFNKHYPYLDILNQASMIYPNKSTLNPRTKSTNHKTDVTISNSKPENSPMDILELTESDMDYSMFEIPDSKVINVYININFAKKFGAAFMQFNEFIERESQLFLNDFSTSSQRNLNFDMFLNDTCGVIFLRPINIYQVDIKTGENLIFKQISEIAFEVLSMVFVLVIKENTDIETDGKLTEFIERAGNSGIQIFIVSNNAKILATSIAELIQQYSAFDDNPVEWSPEHQFLETCGISNPCLCNTILSKWDLQTFVLFSNEERNNRLQRLCSLELLNRVNQAVQTFCSGEF
jgi:rhodanese-related sulfurtransferase